MADIDDLVRHIKKNLSKEYKEDSIRWALINQGYSRTTVDKAMNQAIKEIESEHKVLEEKRKEAERPKITYQLYDENNNLVKSKNIKGSPSRGSFWKRLFGK